MEREIKCPKCGAVFELAVAISQDIEAELRKKYEAEKKLIQIKADKEIENKEVAFEEKLNEEKRKIALKTKEEIEKSTKLEFAELKEQLDEKEKKLEDAREQESAIRKKNRELEDKEKTLELELNRRLDSERTKFKEETLKDVEEKHRLKEAEKDKQLSDMAKQIDELKRKAEQGSQQTQGEVLELELEESLRNQFPVDQIEPVEKGQKGADILHIIKNQLGRTVGKILWETKRTKRWSDAWIQKLKDDQRDAKADIAVLVSEILPEGLRHFGQINDIWVCNLSAAISLGVALRLTITQVARGQQLQTGKNEKMEIVYNYLTGTEFKNKVEAIIEAFSCMKNDLDSERRAMAKRWSAREKQIEKVINNVAGMHGDLEGMIGNTLPPIKILELPLNENENESLTDPVSE